MQTNSRRTILATALAGLAGGCATPARASASPSPDAALLRLGAEWQQAIVDKDAAEATGDIGGDLFAETEAAADRVMAVQPATIAGLALWARVMLWRFDTTITAPGAGPPADLAEYGVNEAFALAAAIDRMASQAAGYSS